MGGRNFHCLEKQLSNPIGTGNCNVAITYAARITVLLTSCWFIWSVSATQSATDGAGSAYTICAYSGGTNAVDTTDDSASRCTSTSTSTSASCTTTTAAASTGTSTGTTASTGATTGTTASTGATTGTCTPATARAGTATRCSNHASVADNGARRCEANATTGSAAANTCGAGATAWNTGYETGADIADGLRHHHDLSFISSSLSFIKRTRALEISN